MSTAAKATTKTKAPSKPAVDPTPDVDCRAVLAKAILERDEAGQRAATFLEQLAEARTAFEVKESAYLEVKAANHETVGLPDAAVLANFRNEQELGALSDAAKRLVDQTNAKLDNARQQEAEGERAVRPSNRRASGNRGCDAGGFVSRTLGRAH